jgi:CheY-like chemotaxis protein
VTGRVLVADGDVDRARAVAAALSTRGLTCRTASHGAQALESALAEVPDAVVCQLDLPLIDAPRLEAILRANPRTRGVAWVFLADHAADRERPGLPGTLVPAPATPELVAGCVLTALGSRPGKSAADPEGGVEGQLTQLPLADLLQLFHVGRKTGVVEVVRDLGRTRRQLGRISLRAGDIVHASVGRVQGKKALFRLLAWDRGSFAFRPDTGDGDTTIQMPTRALLREGLRQVREWEAMAVELPPLSASVALKVPRSALPNVIHPLTQEVLVVLDLCSRVQDVVDQCTYPDYQVLRTLHTLVERGMVELRREASVPELARETRLFSAARTARLREWLELDRPGGPASRDAKLVVVASHPEAARDFAGLLRGLPGVQIGAAVEAGGPAADELIALGRVAVDPEVAIELIHLPAARSFAALRPLAAHRALATLVLLSGPVGQAVAAVREVADALAARPGARLFHVWLIDKGEKVAADELRQHLSLVDAGSLFLVPRENAEKATVLLREMFGRILP